MTVVDSAMTVGQVCNDSGWVLNSCCRSTMIDDDSGRYENVSGERNMIYSDNSSDRASFRVTGMGAISGWSRSIKVRFFSFLTARIFLELTIYER